MKEKLMGLGLDEETADKAAELFRSALNETKEGLEKEKAEMAEEMQKLRLDNAVEVGLLKAGGKNLRVLRALIDKGGISFNEGVISGLDEQIEALKADGETGFLFRTDKPQIAGAAVPEEGADFCEGLSYEQLCNMK
ncbi:MAG: phage scaffolding protein [Firmicutes bacterium]|nr:phage scaffolding protein [Bacillota bacterium]